MPKRQDTRTFDAPLKECLLCGAKDLSFYFRDFNGRSIFRCRACGVQFLNPQYSNEHLKQYYDGYSAEEPAWDAPLNYCHHYYLSLVERYRSPGRLLDVGSGEGHLLRAARERGWQAEGYEIDAELAKRTSDKTGVKVCCGTFSETGWDNGSFDVITVHHVLEHVKDPGSYLKVIHSLLRDEGIFLLVLPNIRSRSATFKFFLERLGLKRQRIGSYYDTDHHLWYFTPPVLKRILDRAGFAVAHTRSGHPVRPGQGAFKRFLMRSLTDRIVWKSTFLSIARKSRR